MLHCSRKTLLLLILFSVFTRGISQDTSLIKRGALHFTSAFEKSQFDQLFLSGKPDLLGLAVSLNPNMNESEFAAIRKTIDNIISESDAKLKSENDLSKKVKFLFEKVHASLFKKYDLGSHFDNIFSSGIYN